MGDKKTMVVFSTTNYSQFQRLLGNRDVNEKRVQSIVDSIQKYGYISNPIIVNEKMEVIDGQGRVEALKRLGLPIEYRVIQGIGIEECWAMNLKPGNWSTMAYAKSYAERGWVDYIRLMDLYEMTKFPLRVLVSYTKDLSTGGGERILIRNGDLQISESAYLNAKSICKYAKRFSDIQKELGGRADLFYIGIGWAYSLPGVDSERLYKTVHDRVNQMHPTAKIKDFLADLSKVYNSGYSRNNRIYFEHEWEVNKNERGVTNT